jgi:CRP-like cAMP-binding protein
MGNVGPGAGGRRRIRVFDADPGLAGDVAVDRLEWLKPRVSVPAIRLPPGHRLPPEPREGIGLLLLDGHLVKATTHYARRAVQLYGPGDIIATGTVALESQLLTSVFSSTMALTRVEMALLDQEFTEAVFRVPPALRQIVHRAERPSHRLARRLAIARIPGIPARLIALLWHLAEAWGRPDGGRTVLPLPLRQGLLADLACTQRESVSRALRALREQRRVEEAPGGHWVLYGPPPRRREDLLVIQARASEHMVSEEEGIALVDTKDEPTSAGFESELTDEALAAAFPAELDRRRT